MKLEKLIEHIGKKVQGLLRDYELSLCEALTNCDEADAVTVSLAAKIKPIGAEVNKVTVSIAFITARIKGDTGTYTIDESQLPLLNVEEEVDEQG